MLTFINTVAVWQLSSTLTAAGPHPLFGFAYRKANHGLAADGFPLTYIVKFSSLL